MLAYQHQHYHVKEKAHVESLAKHKEMKTETVWNVSFLIEVLLLASQYMRPRPWRFFFSLKQCVTQEKTYERKVFSPSRKARVWQSYTVILQKDARKVIRTT